jgi:hypothetical protein
MIYYERAISLALGQNFVPENFSENTDILYDVVYDIYNKEL